MTTEPRTPDPTPPVDPSEESVVDPADEAPRPDELKPLPEDEPVAPHVLKERNRELAQLRAQNRQQAKELDEFKQATLTDQEKAVDAARKEGYAQAEATYKGKLLEAKVRALAAGEFADPADAVYFLDLDGVDPDIDDLELSDMLRKVLEDKPYLSAQAAKPPQPKMPQGPAPTEAPKPKDDWLRSVVRR